MDFTARHGMPGPPNRCVGMSRMRCMQMLPGILALTPLVLIVGVFSAGAAVPAARNLSGEFLAYYVAAQTIRVGLECFAGSPRDAWSFQQAGMPVVVACR
jgi:hypothetical protein